MKNELAEKDIKFSVNYTPSKIYIENEKQLDELINDVTKHFEAQIFSDSNIPEAKDARAQLNKYIKILEDRRKEIKKDFKQPLDDFEKVMKGYVNRLGVLSEKINLSVKDYEEEQKAIRLEKIQWEMAKLAEQFNVEANVIEVHSNWLTKASFTAKGEVRPKVIDEIKDKIKIIAMERERVAADKATIADYAEIAGLDPYAWANMIDQGWSVADIREKIKAAVEEKRVRMLEAERKRAAEDEYQAAMKELERSNAVETNTGLIDPDTGEIIENSLGTSNNMPTTETYEEKQELITATLQLTGTVEQMQALNNFIVGNGIQVVPVE
ncbi:DUF1351 domain-containing protein [Candidatus Enterococcus ferrettii]|uniref:DUF1351 domain-containing protein n=1 Tax=Candidatus Enterococcus ferrettii TaxID=2815324 RepID=A0ABV0EV37_9ENTE|nr:DUF1351 domain-containing protein [Enterococcus sp. 665A]MBO1340345.1 DUF1351 domain-containing protein [Enterococcus sp. 665A]